MTKSFFLSSSRLALLTALLSGCAAGPDFTPPSAPDVTAYDSETTPMLTVDGTQLLRPGFDIPAQWWQLFNSKELNELVKDAVANNPSIAAADAALRAAEANWSAGAASFLPTIDGSFSSQRQKVSAVSNNGVSSIYTLHNASVSASYSPDLFGKTRRTLEQLQANVDAARFQKEAALLSLTGNVVTAAFQEASLREQIKATRVMIAKRQQMLTNLQARFEAGAVAKSAVLEQQSALASAKASLPVLQNQFAANRHALVALAGRVPQNDNIRLFSLAEMRLPQNVPLSVPSLLAERRPDVRASLEALHAASANIGIAQAARFPQVTLTADIGSMANLIGDLFSPGGGFWGLGASVSQSLFDANALANKEEAARALFEQSQAQYKSSVLSAFQDVADALYALRADAAVLSAADDARKAASASLVLVRAQYQAGAVSQTELLAAEIADSSAYLTFAKAVAQRYADTAALFVALGGGWWNHSVEKDHS